MGILLWVFIGLVVGSAAKFVMPGPNAGGVVAGMALGATSAVAGGLVGALLAGGLEMGVDVRSLLLAIAGALWSLLAYRSFAMRLQEAPKT